MMTYLYQLSVLFFELLDSLTYNRCPHCDEVILEGECDWCDQFIVV